MKLWIKKAKEVWARDCLQSKNEDVKRYTKSELHQTKPLDFSLPGFRRIGEINFLIFFF